MSALPQVNQDQELKRSIHKVGTINKNKRIWIANEDITKSFAIGDLLHVTYKFDKKRLEINKANILSNHSVSSRTKKSGRTPIIDIKNCDVTKLFSNIEKVEVIYYPNKIIIRATKNALAKKERAEKTGKNLFELFVGGGTCTHQFKRAGFISKGGLERVDKYLRLFEQNNRSNILTILASIEEVHPSDYPKDIDIVLAGIECKFFTKANNVLAEAIKAFNKGIATKKQIELVKEKENADALVFHVLMAIKAMNPRCVVIEQVVEFSKTESAHLIRTILKQMGYFVAETVGIGTHSNRKRWCLVANMNKAVDLEKLVPEPTQTLDEVLATPLYEREWKESSEIACHNRSSKNSKVGSRAKDATLIKRANTFDTHGARGNEPILKHPTCDLYDKYTNEDILKIHGLDGYKLSGVKTTDRQVLGQGVNDMFYYVAKRVYESI